MSNQRSQYPDILKGVAVILMIQVHIMELFATEEVFNSVLGRVSLFFGGPPAAPVFMAVMGYFVAKSTKGFRLNIFRGLKLLLWGLLLNIGLNFHLLVKVITGSVQLNPWPYIFGVDILFLAGFSILFLALLRKIFRKQIIPWIVLALLTASATMFLPVYESDQMWIHYLQAYFFGNATWSYFPVFPWITYPVLGVIFQILDEKYQLSGFTTKGLAYIGGLVFITIAITFSYGLGISTHLPAYYHHDFLFVLWANAFMVLWAIMIKLLSHYREHNILFRYLQWAGRNVTAFYVIQWLLIGNLATFIYKTQSALASFLWFVAIAAATSVMVLYRNKHRKKFNPDHRSG
ncbi:MAG: heparan-alpha-glucosaminide N-acetyltransferase domain-containing protein [Bacteroidales bacterium]|nr:heparan-alpha-glucosaminide N-acetyltransferase domain-containing protein [Bacteroidales bacterium]MDZ4203678.1 heparan-alpha-glucosaminide N-acetyltransferase domain-containing protein [Bacteroidales bacterium]